MQKAIFNIQNETDFERCALQVFKHQFENNKVYRSFCDLLYIHPSDVKNVAQIPFLPIQFFKTHQVLSTNQSVQETFTSSGTTGAQVSKHLVADVSWYQTSYTKAFEHFYGPVEDYTVLGLLPNYLEREGSSLIYMVNDFIQKSNKPKSGFYLDNLSELSKTLEELSEKIIFLENEVTIKNLKDHIFLKVLETFRNNWDDMLGMLLRYKDEFGNIDVKNNVKKEYKELAKWVHYIKLVHRRKKTNFLKNNQIEYLNKLGFNWRIEGETVDHPNNFKPKIKIYPFNIFIN